MSRAYVFRRFLQMILTLFGILTLIFFMFRLIPADPVALLVDASLTPEGQARLREIWGLDQPVLKQFTLYLGNVLKGDFGNSFFYRTPVIELIGPFLFNSFALMAPSVLLASVLAIVLGSILGWQRGTRLERWGVVVPLLLHSIPFYWLGLLVMMIFSFWLGLFPSSGMRELGYSAEGFWDVYLNVDFLKHLALPGLSAVLYFMASPMMLMRSSMIEVRNEEYLDIIRAKGVPERTVVKHAVRNASLPVITYLAVLSTIAVAGSVLLETVFSWPGMGRALVTAVQTLDYPMAQAAFFIWSGAVVVAYFLVDILYYKIDPRISYK